MTGVMLGCNGMCMFNEKKILLRKAEPMGKVPWFTTCANMLHERVPGRSTDLRVTVTVTDTVYLF